MPRRTPLRVKGSRTPISAIVILFCVFGCSSPWETNLLIQLHGTIDEYDARLRVLHRAFDAALEAARLEMEREEVEVADLKKEWSRHWGQVNDDYFELRDRYDQMQDRGKRYFQLLDSIAGAIRDPSEREFEFGLNRDAEVVWSNAADAAESALSAFALRIEDGHDISRKLELAILRDEVLVDAAEFRSLASASEEILQRLDVLLQLSRVASTGSGMDSDSLDAAMQSLDEGDISLLDSVSTSVPIPMVETVDARGLQDAIGDFLVGYRFAVKPVDESVPQAQYESSAEHEVRALRVVERREATRVAMLDSILATNLGRRWLVSVGVSEVDYDPDSEMISVTISPEYYLFNVTDEMDFLKRDLAMERVYSKYGRENEVYLSGTLTIAMEREEAAELNVAEMSGIIEVPVQICPQNPLEPPFLLYSPGPIAWVDGGRIWEQSSTPSLECPEIPWPYEGHTP